MTTMFRRSFVLVSMLILSMGIALTPPSFAQVTDCTGQPDGTVCSDGNTCTTGDTCTAGGCAGTMIVDDGVRLDRLSPGSSTAVISWGLAPGATGSDIVRGLVSALPVSPTDSGEIPLAKNTSSTSAQDSTVPAPGTAFWYLVRGRNKCGGGPWGFETRNGLPAIQRQPHEGCVMNVNASPRLFDNALSLGNPQPTVTDITTCLEWEKKSQVGETSIHDVSFHSDWDTANHGWINLVNEEGFTGHSDWRVPSNIELQSIVESGHGSPTINTIFGPTAGHIYWSSVYDLTASPPLAWGVDFSSGQQTEVPEVYIDNWVRAVRDTP